MAVCSCHVTYAFQSESTLYSCLNGWPNGWVFVYEVSGFGFESSCSQHFKLIFFKISIHFGTSNEISRCRKLSLLLINIYLAFSMQRRPVQAKEYYNFSYSEKKELKL